MTVKKNYFDESHLDLIRKLQSTSKQEEINRIYKELRSVLLQLIKYIYFTKRNSYSQYLTKDEDLNHLENFTWNLLEKINTELGHKQAFGFLNYCILNEVNHISKRGQKRQGNEIRYDDFENVQELMCEIEQEEPEWYVCRQKISKLIENIYFDEKLRFYDPETTKWLDKYILKPYREGNIDAAITKLINYIYKAQPDDFNYELKIKVQSYITEQMKSIKIEEKTI